MRLSPLLLIGLLACAPVREERTGGDGLGPSSTQSAVFFLWEDQGLYELGQLYLVDADFDCDELRRTNFELWWWDLPPETLWYQVSLLKGDEAGDWERPFESFWAFNSRGDTDYQNAAYYYGTWGTSDDDVVIGREQRGYLGQEPQAADDVVELQRYAETGEVIGAIESEDDTLDLNFRAQHCGRREQQPWDG